MPLDLPLSALRKHAKDRILDVDAFLEQVLDPGTAPDSRPAPRGERDGEGGGGAQPPSARP